MTGMKLTKDSFGLAVGSGSSRTVLLANSNGLELGSGADPETNGSYVSISGSGVSIGSLADLYVNANNFKLQTNAANSTSGSIGTTILAIGTNLNGIASNTDLTTLNASSSVSFIVNDNGVFIKGYVYAAGGSFTGDVIANSFKAIGNNGLFAADSNHFGLYKKGSNNSIGDGIITFDSSGNMTAGGDLTITSGKNFTITSSNFKVNPAASGGADYFYVGDSGNSPSSCIRYVSAQTVNNETTAAHLEVRGAIIATSFTLGSTEIALDSDGHLPSSLIDSSSYSVNGISTIKWGSPASSKTTYVGLTSNTDGGLLLGANKDIIIPRVAPNNDDNTADTTDTIVKINKDGIKFNAYNSSGTETAHIYLDSDGLAVSGKRISINNSPVWARDDIIIMCTSDNTTAPAWRKKQKSIEAYMKNGSVRVDNKGEIVDSGGTVYTRPGGASSGDWVLIKPYYDTQLNFANSMVFGTSTSASVTIPLTSSEAEPYFGEYNQYYYKVSFYCYCSTQSQYNMTVSLQATASGKETISEDLNDDNVTPTDSFSGGTGGVFQFTPGTQNNPKHIEFTADLSTNFCLEDYEFSIVLKATTASAWVNIQNMTVVASCPSTTSRVPCTVFYYP